MNRRHEETFSVVAKGRDDIERRFIYKCRVQRDLTDPLDPSSERLHWKLFVYNDGDDVQDDEACGYRATGVEIGEFLAVSTEMFADRDDFRQVGLPEAMIRELALRSRHTICSSSPRCDMLGNEQRSRCAEKVWRRLVEKKLAVYIASLDRYIFLGTHGTDFATRGEETTDG